tara:strand:+ start:3721 stop:3927 length:207 start_codon:yes stop_codon:yes gene_type:complete
MDKLLITLKVAAYLGLLWSLLAIFFNCRAIIRRTPMEELYVEIYGDQQSRAVVMALALLIISITLILA